MAEKKTIRGEDLNGVYKEMAELLGVDVVVQIHELFRGQQITFPVTLVNKKYIAAQIAQEYDGGNIKQLATKYGYSERWIRKILKDSEKNL